VENNFYYIKLHLKQQYFKLEWGFMKIFHVIGEFFARKSAYCDDGIKQLSRLRCLMHWLVIFCGGVLMAMAFPPLNLSLAAFCALTILWLEVRNRSAWKAALGGWLWGMGYALCSFFWLREINPAIPWMLMFVLGAFYIPVGWIAAVANRYILLEPEVRKSGFTAQASCRKFVLWRQLLWCLVTASSVVLVEYARSRVLPWNYIGIAFYRNTVMMQLARYTGVYGLSMLAALFNAALVLAVLTVAYKDTEKNTIRYRRPWPLLITIVLLALNMALGIKSLRARRTEYAKFPNQVKLTLVQGNLSQRRSGNEDTGREALYTYADLTRTQRGIKTDLVVWPETAVNYPLRGRYSVSYEYRSEVRNLAYEMDAPLLLGTLEYDMSTNPPGSLNSAVLTDSRNILRDGYIDMYSKVHPVPFGEYVPFRKYLPQWVIDCIDMNRDLTPGKSLAPISLNDKVKLGVNICFEDVFTYISRAEQLLGANLLLVITNDAWYPTSSEPEQHLANSMVRAIEMGLPMVRCGNDSATCLISPAGEIIWSLAEELKFEDGQPFRRGAGAGTITVRLPESAYTPRTFYARYGNWLVGLCAFIMFAGVIFMWSERMKFVRRANNQE